MKRKNEKIAYKSYDSINIIHKIHVFQVGYIQLISEMHMTYKYNQCIY